MKGFGILVLGRATEGPVIAKHRIKGVDRFLANEDLESLGVSKARVQANLLSWFRMQGSLDLVSSEKPDSLYRLGFGNRACH